MLHTNGTADWSDSDGHSEVLQLGRRKCAICIQYVNGKHYNKLSTVMRGHQFTSHREACSKSVLPEATLSNSSQGPSTWGDHSDTKCCIWRLRCFYTRQLPFISMGLLQDNFLGDCANVRIRKQLSLCQNEAGCSSSLQRNMTSLLLVCVACWVTEMNNADAAGKNVPSWWLIILSQTSAESCYFAL